MVKVVKVVKVVVEVVVEIVGEVVVEVVAVGDDYIHIYVVS